jgi:hypothetical protein
MPCNDEITIDNDGVTKETKSTIFKTVLEEGICVFSNMYCVFSNMYSRVQHISQMNNFVDQIMKDHPIRR